MTTPRLFSWVKEQIRPYLTTAGREALGNLIWMILWTGLSYGCGLAVIFTLTAALGPQQYGAYSAATILYSYLILVGSVGAGAVVVREAARPEEDSARILGAYFRLTTATSTAVALAAAGGAWLLFTAPDERLLLTLLAVGVPPLSVSAVPFFIAHHRQARSAGLTCLGEVLALLAILALDRGGALTLVAIGAIYAVKAWGVSVLLYLVYHLTVHPLRWSAPRGEARRMWHSAWPLVLAAVVNLVPLNAGIFFVRPAHGETAAAVYGIATMIATAYYMFAALALQILLPHILGPHGLERCFLRKLAVFAVAFFGVMGLAFFGAGWLAIELVLPAAYRPAVVPMGLLLLGAANMLLASVVHQYLLRFHLERFVMAVQVAGCALYAGGCLVLVPAAGDWVAAGLTVLVTFTAGLVCLVRVGKALAAVRPDSGDTGISPTAWEEAPLGRAREQ